MREFIGYALAPTIPFMAKLSPKFIHACDRAGRNIREFKHLEKTEGRDGYYLSRFSNTKEFIRNGSFHPNNCLVHLCYISKPDAGILDGAERTHVCCVGEKLVTERDKFLGRALF